MTALYDNYFSGYTALDCLRVSELRYDTGPGIESQWVIQPPVLVHLQYFQKSILSREIDLQTTALSLRPIPKSNVFYLLGEENMESSRTGSEWGTAFYWLVNIWKKHQTLRMKGRVGVFIKKNDNTSNSPYRKSNRKDKEVLTLFHTMSLNLCRLP